jgi:hypothetical protein
MTKLKVGDVTDLSERDYRYGTGRLILRSYQDIGDRTLTTDGEWVDLDRFELRSVGKQLGPEPRHAAVRVRGLHVWRGPIERP